MKSPDLGRVYLSIDEKLRSQGWGSMRRERNTAGIARATLLFAGCLSLGTCGAAVSPAPDFKPISLPLSVQSESLALRADVRELTPHSVNLVIQLVVQTSIPNVSVSAMSRDRRLTIWPLSCDFRVLAPPVVQHADHPPYPLPAIPLCSLVLRAPNAGSYPLTLRVRDAAGNDLVAPIHTAVVIQGGSS